jgi:hypothetical protein
MRSAATLAALYGLLLNVGLAQVNQMPSLQPTRLEAFAGHSTAHVAWSREVGRVESAEARAVVTSLVIEDAVQTPRRMRGIRIDLANQNSRDQVYLEEAKLEAVKKALEEIESGIESFRKERRSAPYSYLGSCELRQPYPSVHTLNAAFYIAPDSSGLSLSAFKDQDFRFPDHSPSELAAAIDRAIDQLKQR